MSLKQIGKAIVLTKLHLLTLAIITLACLPIVNWYLSYTPIWGVDFFLTVSLVNILNMNFVPPYAFWGYSMFDGFPIFIYPFLNIYLLGIFSQFFDLVASAQIYMMVSTLLFVFGAYFLFFVLSRSFVLSAVLAIATAYSGGLYETLTWAGSLPSYGSQAFFPWALGFLAWFLKTHKLRLLLSVALIAGISSWGHPLIYVVYIIPAVIILTVTNFQNGFSILKKIRTLVIFLFFSFLVGLPQFYLALSSIAGQIVNKGYHVATSTTNGPRVATETQKGIEYFNKLQVDRLVTDNHILPFALIAIVGILFAGSILFGRKKDSFLGLLPYLTLVAYFTLYIWLFGQGISIFHGGWYRLFWSVPIWLGALVAVFWGLTHDNIHHFFKDKYLKIIIILCLEGVVLFVGVLYLINFPAQKTIENIIYRGQPSSVNTDIVNLKITDKEREKLKSKLTPSWLNPNDTNFRLYDGDQTVNIFWNSYFKMPLARGYLDPPSGRGYLFWLDAALSETDGQPQLTKAFKYPFETSLSNALFLIDWNGIKYYEGGHTGDVYLPMPTHLQQFVNQEQIMDLNAEKYTKKDVTLRFYEFKNEVVSPILSGTNAPAIGIFGSETGYETLIRALAERGNFNSQVLIPVNLGKNIDEHSLNELKNFDALYLYDYDYKNGEDAFRRLSDYVSAGKKVFIETGVEVKESNKDLPEFFPIEKVRRRGMGRGWDLKNHNNLYGENVNLSKFSPPLFDGDEWKVSFADTDDLRDGAEIILTNKDKIVLAKQKLGSGEVIWSGLNFAYHLTRNHNPDEAVLFNNILASMVDLSVKPRPKSSTKFINPNLRTVEVESARGVLFKEQSFDGWSAKNLNNNSSLKIYRAGPATPGFMYIPLKPAEKTKVEFYYGGSLTNKIILSISVLLIIFLLEEILLRGLLLGRLRRFLWAKSKHHIRRWWEKEDEV